MKIVGAFEAKTRLGDLLDRVAHGEEILITRRGKPAAMLVPLPQKTRDLKQLIKEMFETRDREGPKLGGLTIRELIDEGRRYEMAEEVNRARPVFVLDTSVALSWYFSDEGDPYAKAVGTRLGTAAAIAPSIWPLEVANALLVGERRRRSTWAQAVKWIDYLIALPIVIDEETPVRAWTSTLDLGRKHDLSAYDAAYLELALRRDLPIATLDNKLKTAARQARIKTFEP